MLIGVLGGGQLGRMLALAGVPLGLRFRFLDPSPYAPAGHVGELVVGDFDDPAAMDRFAKGLDAATFEFENVPVAAGRVLAQRTGVFPPVLALETGQDRISEKTLFQRVGIEVPAYRACASQAEVDAAARDLGLPLVAKTRRMGYDGRGQMVLRDSGRVPGCFASLGGAPLIVERLVRFDREVSLVACRAKDGAFAAYPLVENVHQGGILRASTVPAPDSSGVHAAAITHARAVADALGYVGVFAIEFFEFEGRLLANEMAPRVHNSGHWTIECAATSQFENHCRAVAGLPLGDTRFLYPGCVMVNLIGAVPDAADVLRIPGAHLHLYGKEPRPGRKVGHITITLEDANKPSDALDRVLALPGARKP
ncbi:5-(carboxyamino)imidazole ribonucleotide synthase [Phycisphaerales bacterium]|nr:5-(carboxyamino)imidazole ribonucleotide synthase [Phycisphaerales bacterium]